MQDQIIFLLNPAIHLIYAVSFLILYYRSGHDRAVFGFVVANLAAVLGFVCRISVTGSTELVAGTLSHILFLACNILIINSLCYRVNIAPPMKAFLAVSLVSTAMGLLAAINNALMAELVIVNIGYGLLFVLGLQALSRSTSNHHVDRIINLMLIFMCAHHFIRVAMLMIFEPEINALTFHTSLFFPVTLVIVAASTIMLSTAVIGAFMVDQFRIRSSLASLDPVGGLLMRGAFEAQAKKMIQRSREEDVPLTLLLMDIDHFKQVNDIFGHQAGDEVIANLSRLISSLLRETDIAGRVGGEEFCALAWDCEPSAARSLAERIRSTFAQLQHDSLPGDMRVTMSVGVADCSNKDGYHFAFAKADEALYAAKDRGRDMVVFEDDIVENPEEIVEKPDDVAENPPATDRRLAVKM